VDATAPVAVAARTHLEVEGAVDLVLLRAKDLGQVLRHLANVLEHSALVGAVVR